MFLKSVRSFAIITSCLSVVGCSTASTTHGGSSVIAKRDIVAHKYAYKRGQIWYGETLSPSRVAPLYQACLNQGQKVADTGNQAVFYNSNAGLAGAVAIGLGLGVVQAIAHKKGTNTLTSCLSAYGFKAKAISETQVKELKTLSSLKQKTKLEELMSGMTDKEFEKSLGSVIGLSTTSSVCRNNAGDTSVPVFERNKC